MYGAPIKLNSYNIYIWNFAIETKLLKKGLQSGLLLVV